MPAESKFIAVNASQRPLDVQPFARLAVLRLDEYSLSAIWQDLSTCVRFHARRQTHGPWVISRVYSEEGLVKLPQQIILASLSAGPCLYCTSARVRLLHFGLNPAIFEAQTQETIIHGQMGPSGWKLDWPNPPKDSTDSHRILECLSRAQNIGLGLELSVPCPFSLEDHLKAL